MASARTRPLASARQLVARPVRVSRAARPRRGRPPMRRKLPPTYNRRPCTASAVRAPRAPTCAFQRSALPVVASSLASERRRVPPICIEVAGREHAVAVRRDGVDACGEPILIEPSGRTAAARPCRDRSPQPFARHGGRTPPNSPPTSRPSPAATSEDTAPSGRGSQPPRTPVAALTTRRKRCSYPGQPPPAYTRSPTAANAKTGGSPAHQRTPARAVASMATRHTEAAAAELLAALPEEAEAHTDEHGVAGDGHPEHGVDRPVDLGGVPRAQRSGRDVERGDPGTGAAGDRIELAGDVQRSAVDHQVADRHVIARQVPA